MPDHRAALTSPPQSQEQLLAQAQQLAGYSLGELAAACRNSDSARFKT